MTTVLCTVWGLYCGFASGHFWGVYITNPKFWYITVPVSGAGSVLISFVSHIGK
jgi:hypothetical protein